MVSPLMPGPRPALGAVAVVAVRPWLARGAFTTANSPRVAQTSIAQIAGVGLCYDEVDEIITTQIARQQTSLRLVNPHSRCVQHKAPLTTEVQHNLQRLDEIGRASCLDRVCKFV